MRKNKAIIFIPGYKGSLLKRDDVVVWANWLSLFKFNKLNLDYTKYPILHADSVLERVSFTKKIYKNVYYSFIKNLDKELPEYGIYNFAYDWRLSIIQNVDELVKYIDVLRSNGIREFNFIGHSLGGLLIYYLLRKSNLINNKFNQHYTNDFNNIFLVGVPFQGTIKGFRDIHLGERIYFNRHLLSSKTVRTFPIMYQVFPYKKDSIIEVHSKQYIDIYSYKNWQNYNFARLNSLSLLEQYSIKKMLENGKNILQQICHYNNVPSNVNIHNFYGIGNKTLSGCCIKNGKLKFDRFDDGDGTVQVNSAKIPVTLNNVTQYAIEGLHAELLNQKSIQEHIFTKLYC